MPTKTFRDFRYYETLLIMFVVALLISNLVGPKKVAVGPFAISAAQLLFPITYIFGDIFTEVYGYGASRRAIWTAFFAEALLAILGLIAVVAPPHPSWHDQKAFETVFFQYPRMIGASLLAFWCGEFVNSFVMAKMKILTGGRHLWTRTVGSTAAGQFVDTCIIMVAAFAGTTEPSVIVNMIISGYVFKVAYEVLATPLTYLIVNKLKRAEGMDPFDYGTRFNPFARHVNS